jgi:hypothetical protein
MPLWRRMRPASSGLQNRSLLWKVPWPRQRVCFQHHELLLRHPTAAGLSVLAGAAILADAGDVPVVQVDAEVVEAAEGAAVATVAMGVNCRRRNTLRRVRMKIARAILDPRRTMSP